MSQKISLRWDYVFWANDRQRLLIMPFDFFGSMPAPMQRSKLYGVELDSISGRIAKQLYQNANISITGFENTTYPDNFFDVVVGNVPFGDYKVFDPKYNKYNFRIHDYFLAKALDQVRPGGMVAVITTKGTLDKANPTIRKYLAERAELVGAIRLPNTAFKDNAGTEVTADILFLQKRERKIDIEPDWVHLGVTENGIAVNSYFAEHPEMMLGSMEYDTRIYGQDSRYTVCVNNDENFNMYETLNKAIGNIKAQMTDFERVADEAEQTEEVIPADPDVRNYTYTFFEGKLYYRENSEMVRKEVSKTAEERIRCLDEIRTITRELIDIQMEGCSEEELSDKQRLLNEKYDSFAKQYGAITSKANRAAFRDDSDYPLLCSLEEVNEDGQVKKADMFYKQTIKAKTVIERVETAVEALNVSVNEFGYVNLVWDGTPRIRSCLHHFLGAEVSDYVEEMLKHFLLGAIRRVFSPGSKYEEMLCLVGGQGAGKSSFFRLLAIRDEWFSDDLKKLDDDRVFLKLQGHWIIEMSEMLATSSAKSIEEIRSFISRQKETYRTPYEAQPKDRLRQCVFGGSSNTLDFLPLDRAGNRRFLPIMIYPENAEVHILEDEDASRAYLLQVWAEAMTIYRSGHYSMKFSKSIQRQLVEVQKDFMPEDTEAGQIQGFLEHYTGSMVCSKQLFKEALGHTYDEPKRWQLHNINEIMNTVVTGWKPFSNPRMFTGYGRQRGWERDVSGNELPGNEDGFVELSEEECRQLELPKEWIA